MIYFLEIFLWNVIPPQYGIISLNSLDNRTKLWYNKVIEFWHARNTEKRNSCFPGHCFCKQGFSGSRRTY